MSVPRRTALKAIGVAGGLSLASGSVFARDAYDDERPAGSSAVRVAHFSPDAPNVDVLVDGDQVLDDVPYGAISPYLELDPGTYTVAITAAGDPDAVVFEGEVEVGDAFYTIAAIGELGAETFRPEILVDADPLPADAEEGAAFVRAAHFSPDAPAVDIYANGTPLVENVSFEDVSEYLAVPAGEYTLSIRPAGEETEVAAFDISLEAGTPYTGYAIGYLEPPEEFADREFTVELAVDGPMADEDEPVDDKADEKDEPADEKDEPVDDKVDEKDEPVDEKEPVDDKVDEKEPVDDKKPADDKVDEKEPVDDKKPVVEEKPAADAKEAADAKKEMAKEMADEKEAMADAKQKTADEKSMADAVKKAAGYDC